MSEVTIFNSLASTWQWGSLFCPLVTIVQKHYEISQEINIVFLLEKKHQSEGGK